MHQRTPSSGQRGNPQNGKDVNNYIFEKGLYLEYTEIS